MVGNIKFLSGFGLFSGANEANDMLTLGSVYITSESSVLYGDTKPPPSNSGKVKVFIPGITKAKMCKNQQGLAYFELWGPALSMTEFINGKLG